MGGRQRRITESLFARALIAPALVIALFGAGQGVAQQAAPAAEAGGAAADPALGQVPLLVITPDRVFAGTRFGRAMQARIKAQAEALEAENRRIEAGLEAEERSLTDRRPMLPPADFRKLATEFDTKVEGIRRAQEAKSRALAAEAAAGRDRFFATALPVLGNLMAEMGAVAILDRDAVLASLGSIDVTDRAIAEIDAVLGEGPPADAALTPPTAPASAPATAPQP